MKTILTALLLAAATSAWANPFTAGWSCYLLERDCSREAVLERREELRRTVEAYAREQEQRAAERRNASWWGRLVNWLFPPAEAHGPPAWRVAAIEICNGSECTVSSSHEELSKGHSRPRFAGEESCRAMHEFVLREAAVQAHDGRSYEFRRKAVEAGFESGVLSVNVVCEQEPPCSEVGLYGEAEDDLRRCARERRQRMRADD